MLIQFLKFSLTISWNEQKSLNWNHISFRGSYSKDLPTAHSSDYLVFLLSINICNNNKMKREKTIVY